MGCGGGQGGHLEQGKLIQPGREPPHVCSLWTWVTCEGHDEAQIGMGRTGLTPDHSGGEGIQSMLGKIRLCRGGRTLTYPEWWGSRELT